MKWPPAGFSEALGVENTRNIQKHTDFSEAPPASLKPGRADFTEVENRTSVKPGFGFRKPFVNPSARINLATLASQDEATNLICCLLIQLTFSPDARCNSRSNAWRRTHREKGSDYADVVP